jgi:7,8-didemethyl-8-hydroxy-5-deazariboflavin synthase CofH subunit
MVEPILNKPASEWTAVDIEALLTAPPETHAAICRRADELTRKRHGDRVTYVVNRNINFSNTCSIRCHFCAFHATHKPEQFRLSVADVVAKANETPFVSELCIQGGIDEAIELGFYEDLVRALKQWKPTIHIHAFSPQEIISLAAREELGVGEILARLRTAGLDSIPGTASEILEDDIRKLVSPRRLTAGDWQYVVETAHTLGIRSSATMMYGHVETPLHRAKHMVKIRRLQEKTRGFTEFVPMPFMADNTALERANLVRPGQRVSFADVERTLAVSRLYFDDVIPNIQTSWVKTNIAFAAGTLRTGANDLGGTLYEENITRLAGGSAGEYTSPEEFQNAAARVGLTAVERDTLYRIKN